MATKMWVNVGSGNGLLPDHTKPSPASVLTYHHRCSVNFSGIHLRARSAQELYLQYIFRDCIFFNYYHISQGPIMRLRKLTESMCSTTGRALSDDWASGSLQWRHVGVMTSQITSNATVCLSAHSSQQQRTIKLHIFGLLWGESSVGRWFNLTSDQ